MLAQNTVFVVDWGKGVAVAQFSLVGDQSTRHQSGQYDVFSSVNCRHPKGPGSRVHTVMSSVYRMHAEASRGTAKVHSHA